ncbi:hypothetical protein EMIT0P228_650002 [Pseudomonas brassicacearum]
MLAMAVGQSHMGQPIGCYREQALLPQALLPQILTLEA